MLTLTDGAVSAIRNLTTQPELPEETGLRIMSRPTAARPSRSPWRRNPGRG